MVNSDSVAWNKSELGVITWSEDVVTKRRDTKFFLRKKKKAHLRFLDPT